MSSWKLMIKKTKVFDEGTEMSEMKSDKSLTAVLPKYPLISRTKIRESFFSIIFFVPPKMFLVSEYKLKNYI